MEDYIYKLLENYNVYINEWYKSSWDKTTVTINEYLFQEEDFSDDENESIMHNYQIDIWGHKKYEVDKITKEIYKILKTNGFSMDNGQTLNEEEKHIYRKSLRMNYSENI